MPRPAADPPDRRELAHRLRGPLNNLQLWSAVLNRYLGEAPPPVQRALEGLNQAVAQHVAVIGALLEREAPAEPAPRDHPPGPGRPPHP